MSRNHVKHHRRWWPKGARFLSEDGAGISRRVQLLIEDLEERQLELLRQRRRMGRDGEGVCQSCGRPISARRMKLLDGDAVLCAACALVARRTRALLDPLARRN